MKEDSMEEEMTERWLNDYTMDAIVRALDRYPYLTRRTLQQRTSHRKTNRDHFQYALERLTEEGSIEYADVDDGWVFYLTGLPYHPRIGPCPVCGR